MKIRQILALFLVCLFCLFALAGCDSSGGDETEDSSDGASQSTPSEESSSEPADEISDVLDIVKNGTSEYRIVIKDSLSNELAITAYTLRDEIEAATGVSLEVLTDFEHTLVEGSAATDYEILIGTTRDGKYFEFENPQLSGTDHLITVVGSRIVILGGSTSAIIKGVNAFISTYLPTEETENWQLSADIYDLHVYERAGALTVMSQNLLNNNTEHASKVLLGSGASVDQSGKNSIANRQPRIRSLFLTYMPDVIGLQECGNWHTFLKNDSALKSAGYELIECSKGNKLSILYNTNTLTALANGSIYLTEDPENLACSVEWNSNGNPRLAHFVRFRDNETGKTFIVVNCHIGFENSTLQYNQTRVVAEYCARLAETYGDAVICTGDFNSKKGSNHYDGFVDTFADGFMTDTKYAAIDSSTGTGSFHALGSRELDNYAIDQIMVSENDWFVLTYAVDNTVFGNGDEFYSDHFGVVATMMLAE